MATKINDKFTVLKNEDIEKYLSHVEKELLGTLIDNIQIGREKDGKSASNTYYVVNTDETYAEKVLQIILEGEDEKGTSTPMDWEKAEHYLNLMIKEYEVIPTGIYALRLTLYPLKRRFNSGERTKELYDEIMSCE